MWAVYLLAASIYAVTRNLNFDSLNSALPGLVILFIVAAALMEEIVFRGLVPHALIRVWGSTKRGLTNSVILSALFFCSFHLLDIFSGRPALAVLLQTVEAFYLGVFLGAIVLCGKSIYPAVLLHGVVNLFAYLIIGEKGLEPTPMSWLLLALLMLLPALFSIYQLLEQEGTQKGSSS